MTTERDIRNQIAYARKEGKAEGKAEGIAEGTAKGKAEGKAEGQIETRLEIAKAMKDNGFDVDAIAKCTNLTPEEISDL